MALIFYIFYFFFFFSSIFQQGCTSDFRFWFSLQKPELVKKYLGDNRTRTPQKKSPHGRAPLASPSDLFCLSHCVHSTFHLSLILGGGWVFVALRTGGWSSTCCQYDLADATLLRPIRNDDDPPPPSSATDPPLPLSKAISQAVLCDKQIKFTAWQPPPMKWQNGGIRHISFLLEIQRDASSWCDNCKAASAACRRLEPVEMDSWFGRLLV